MSALEQLFEAVSGELGRGRRGGALAGDFVAAFGERAPEYLDELARYVGDAARRLGLADWPGGRLGRVSMGFARVGEPECLAALAVELATGGASADELGWLGGPLFRSGRLEGYLRAAEEDSGKALAYLRLNIRSELSAMRRAADPVGAALFDNLAGAAKEAAEDGGLHWEHERFVLARGEAARPADEEGAERHREVLVDSGALAPFAEAVRRNELRDEGQRNLPMRGAALTEPLVKHDRDWAQSEPAKPACEAVDVSALANLLRPDFPEAESLREHAVAVDDEGSEVWGAAAPEVAGEVATAGSAPLRAFVAEWAARVEDAPGVSQGRRAKLLCILGVVETTLVDFLGDPPVGWESGVRDSLGIKPQTFSDDWSLLRELAPAAGVSR